MIATLIFIAGAAAIAVGAWWIYPPIGLIVAGALAVAGTLYEARGREPAE